MTQKKQDQKDFPYLPHTKEDREQMLRSIGARSLEDLLAHIPEEIRLKDLNINSGMSELELSEYMKSLAGKNEPCSRQSSFLGAGFYHRYTPAAVASVVSRSEFATAYTPYQPEVSQGTLQAIYEFQTAICLLTGMDVANASVYDGPHACAEAALMASRVSGRKKTIMAESLNPEYRLVTKTYLETCELEVETTGSAQSVLNPQELKLTDAASLIVQYPNYFGSLEDLDNLAAAAHAAGALLVVVADPINLGLLEAPGKLGADIVVGDAQQCGNGLSFGGPSAGFMATRSQYLRQLPGRLCGMTVDSRGNRAFTLTLQTREQHIRRAKATSNICTNQSLNALTMLVYLCMMGPQGLRELAEISLQRAHRLKELLCAIEGVKMKFDSPFVNEFLLELQYPVEEVLSALQERGILGGISPAKQFPHLSDCLLVAVTEMNSLAEIDRYAQCMKEICLSLKKQAKTKQGSPVAACSAG